MRKSSIVLASIAFAAIFSTAAVADPLIQLGGLQLGDTGTVPNPGAGAGDIVGTVGNVVEQVTNGSAGVPGVAEVTVGNNGLSDTSVTLLGGGGSTVPVGVGGILGNSPINLGLNLPGTADLPIEIPLLPPHGNPPGGNGTNGQNGTNGANGNGGTFNIYLSSNGGSGGNGTFFGGGGGGGSQQMNNASSRLRMLLKILNDRDWLRLVAGNTLCLPAFGTASVNGWLNQNEMAQLQQVVNAYARDIATLQKLISSCRGNRSYIGSNDVKRVIGIDIKDGRPVLFML